MSSLVFWTVAAPGVGLIFAIAISWRISAQSAPGGSVFTTSSCDVPSTMDAQPLSAAAASPQRISVFNMIEHLPLFGSHGRFVEIGCREWQRELLCNACDCAWGGDPSARRSHLHQS